VTIATFVEIANTDLISPSRHRISRRRPLISFCFFEDVPVERGVSFGSGKDRASIGRTRLSKSSNDINKAGQALWVREIEGKNGSHRLANIVLV
jgi:hypothetical protein